MKVLEWSRRFSHYKFMGIFPDAQGQLTPHSKVFDLFLLRPLNNLSVMRDCSSWVEPVLS